jgi:hypothetical protein
MDVRSAASEHVERAPVGVDGEMGASEDAVGNLSTANVYHQ